AAAGAGAAGAGAYWEEAFQRLVGTLRLRATMLAELSGPAGRPASGGGGAVRPPSAGGRSR
ncbi:hypothetical protein B7P34_32565, partial [Streptosporangium nondiastaticum]